MARGFGTTFGVGATDVVTCGSITGYTTVSHHLRMYKNGAGGASAGRQYNHATAAWIGGAVWSIGTVNWSGTQGAWTAGTVFANGDWHSWGLSYDASAVTNKPIIYQDGIAAAVANTVVQPVGTWNTTAQTLEIGNTAGIRNWDGMLAEYGMWSVILNPSEFAALGAGCSPAFIRPRSLIEYVPLVRENVSLKLAAPTITGTAVQPHPRIVMPRRRRISYVILPPLRQVHYRFRTDGNAADAAPTWGAAEDAGGFDPGASNFRLRVSVANTGTAVTEQPFELYLSKNSGAYAPITTTSTGGVKSADASTDADETAIKVPRLTPGT